MTGLRRLREVVVAVEEGNDTKGEAKVKGQRMWLIACDLPVVLFS
jgi:hypothetical protein